MTTITKKDLINLGYGSSFSSEIIRRAKEIMVEKGYPYYLSKKLNRVPSYAVEQILGFDIDESVLARLSSETNNKIIAEHSEENISTMEQ